MTVLPPIPPSSSYLRASVVQAIARCRSRLQTVLALTIVALLAPAAVAGSINPDNPPHGLFSDEWMIVKLMDQRAGWAHATIARSGDRVTTRTIMSLKISRAGQAIEITTMEASEETLAGVPISFESTMKMATMATATRGRVVDGRVHIESTQFGVTTRQEHPFPQGAVMTWGSYAEQTRRGFEKGTKYEMPIYAPSLAPDRATNLQVEIVGPDSIDLPGEQVKCIQTKLTMQAPGLGALAMTSWIDADGRPLKTVMPFVGVGSLEMIRADKQTAMQESAAPEFFVDTMVRADHRIDRKQARQIRYRLRVTGPGEPLPDLPGTDMQKIVKRSDTAMELTVARSDHDAARKAGAVKPDESLAEYLEANLWINGDDPKVIAMAKTAVPDAATKSPYEIADTLRRYVTEVIEDKNLSVGFATASEVCRNKVGDCSEHAVLLAALGRVHRIPTRVVMGLVYVPWFAGADDVFGFHMWTQFHLGGKWIDFDAAQRESDCNPTHLALGVSSLKNAALADMVFSLLHIMGRLEIDVLEATPETALTDLKRAKAS